MNAVGLATALATFFGIWWGHVGVRLVERRVVRLWPPMLAAATLGLGLEIFSLWTDSRPLSAAAGVFGVTLLWDAFDLLRQEKRVRAGHAPANPDNPRHARILAESPSALTLDLLARDPVGRPVSPEEARRLVEENA